MNFNSFEYAAFITIVVVINWLLPRRFRPLLLLVASYLFYASWSVLALGILIAVSVIAWGGALLLDRHRDRTRAIVTAVVVVAAAGSLVVFKLIDAFSPDRVGEGITGRILVPAGLSFFSFQAISYVIDVKRRVIPPNRSLLDVALFTAFFPHLLAGPIVRANKLIPSFHDTPRWPNRVRTAEAAELVLVGLFKKVVIADPILTEAINTTKASQLGVWHLLVLLAGLLVAGYTDVTGYIDIARGSAKFLGIDMQRNSLYPLTRSTGYADFWRRWQLTLMMWLRDYVYQPIRGDGKRHRDLLALFMTFFVLGLWHGIDIGWVLWGIASGVIIVVERELQTRRSARRRAQTVRARQARSKSMLPKPPRKSLSLIVALALVAATFPLAGGGSLRGIGELYGSFLRFDGSMPTSDLTWLLVLGGLGVIVLDGRERRREAVAGHPDPVTVPRALAFGTMVVAIIVMAGPAARTFVYQTF